MVHRMRILSTDDGTWLAVVYLYQPNFYYDRICLCLRLWTTSQKLLPSFDLLIRNNSNQPTQGPLSQLMIVYIKKWSFLPYCRICITQNLREVCTSVGVKLYGHFDAFSMTFNFVIMNLWTTYINLFEAIFIFFRYQTNIVTVSIRKTNVDSHEWLESGIFQT